MAGAGGRIAVAAAAAVALVLGAAAGWIAARASMPPPPPPPAFVNPLADAKKGEVLVLTSNDGVVDTYRVLETTDETVLLSDEKAPAGQPAFARQLRVARSYWGAFIILGGDVDPLTAEAAARDLVVVGAVPENLFVETLGRSLRCWKVSARHRVWGDVTIWLSDELPVHGYVRMDTVKGKKCEVTGFSFGEGR
jgi:hypothetical protein